jgi:hypothetical protein
VFSADAFLHDNNGARAEALEGSLTLLESEGLLSATLSDRWKVCGHRFVSVRPWSNAATAGETAQCHLL